VTLAEEIKAFGYLSALQQNAGYYDYRFAGTPQIKFASAGVISRTGYDPFSTAGTTEKGTTVTFAIGDKIHVKLTDAKVGSRQQGGNATFNTTTSVTEREGATHFLYINSGTPVADGKVNAEFDAKVTGEYRRSTSYTTEVQEIAADGKPIFTHYLYLSSLAVTRLPREATVTLDTQRTADESGWATSAERVNPGLSISISDDDINSADVIRRIAELEDALAKAPRYVITRQIVREGQDRELGRFKTAVAAEEFISFNDYNRGRVDVDIADAKLNEEDEAELESLQRLSAAGRTLFGTTQWTNGVLLQCSGFFDASWARGLAADELKPLDGVDSWPLNLVDWEEAADQRRDSDYLRIEFDDENYWGVRQ
jgi:hypothetical protein